MVHNTNSHSISLMKTSICTISYQRWVYWDGCWLSLSGWKNARPDLSDWLFPVSIRGEGDDFSIIQLRLAFHHSCNFCVKPSSPARMYPCLPGVQVEFGRDSMENARLVFSERKLHRPSWNKVRTVGIPLRSIDRPMNNIKKKNKFK